MHPWRPLLCFVFRGRRAEENSPSARLDKSIGKGSSRTVGKEYAGTASKTSTDGSVWRQLLFALACRLDKMEAKLLQAEANF